MPHKTDTALPPEPLSLKQRLIFALLTPLIIILATSSIFDYRLANKTANQAHDQALADNVFDLEAHIKKVRLPADKLDLTEEAEAMLRSSAPDMLYFAVLDPFGKVVAGVSDLPVPRLAQGKEIQFSDGHYRGKAVRIAAHQVNLNTEELQIVVVETTEKRKQASSRILTAMVLPNLAVILATMLAVIFGVRQGLLPLNEVERDIAARSANDLHEIELSGTPAEIRPMLLRLNELFALLRETVEIQQRFIADAAHQLRTPLAGLQTQLDLATAEHAFANTPERLQLLEEATARIGHLLNQLLAYARAETSGTTQCEREEVSLDHLVENSASLFLDAALAKDIDLGFEITPATIFGLPWMVQEALSNLIDNAIHYTPAGGIVTVRCGQEDGQPYLEVEDSGPGIPEEEVQHVFERFYRIPGSIGHGCGLGLAIVREIADMHAATVVLKNRPSGGLQAKIIFSGGSGRQNAVA
ncbi:MAG: sensor histidine kinase N-terminal domain-containing protein [Betaproteobacteria bacterium]|nr:sensor histidine kinase N-terminal domain-containing protein [Betaproteobacteria bacterium]